MPSDASRNQDSKKRRTRRAQPKTAAGNDRSCSENEAERRASEAFRRDLVTRGEAAEPVDGELPPGATHEIVGTDEKGVPQVRRRRFSAY